MLDNLVIVEKKSNFVENRIDMQLKSEANLILYFQNNYSDSILKLLKIIDYKEDELPIFDLERFRLDLKKMIENTLINKTCNGETIKNIHWKQIDETNIKINLEMHYTSGFFIKKNNIKFYTVDVNFKFTRKPTLFDIINDNQFIINAKEQYLNIEIDCHYAFGDYIRQLIYNCVENNCNS